MNLFQTRPQVTTPVSPRGDRLLSIAVNEAADKDFGKAFARAQRAGLQVIGLPLA